MSNSDLLAIAGFILTIAFGALSVYFYLKSKRTKQIRFRYGRVVLQTKAHPDVHILFKQDEIENLTRARITSWNVGTEAIRVADLPGETFPSVTFPEGVRILSVANLAFSSEHSKFGVTWSARTVTFHFAFLNPGDGGVTEILYERAPGQSEEAEFSAPVIDGLPPDIATYSSRTHTREFVGSLVFSALTTALCFALASQHLGNGSASDVVAGIILVAVGIAMAVGAAQNIRERIRHRLPEYAEGYMKQ